MEILKKEIDEIYEQLINFRRYLHENPEVGFNVDNTYKYIWDNLKEIGIDPIKCGQKGIVAYIGKSMRKTILFRADIDGLPIKEETLLDFKSLNGAMHACGHDIHTTILFGLSKILKKYENKLNLRVKLVFQPAEELLEGAKDMIEDGVLDDVDAAFSIHVLTGTNYPCGTIILPNIGVSAPSSDFFEVNVFGVASHGAMPEKGVDPVVASSHIILGLDNLISHEKAITDNAIITIGQVNGGNAFNTISSLVTLKGSIRTYDDVLRNKLKQRIKEIVIGFAHSFKCEASIEYVSGCPTLVNDKKLHNKVEGILKEHFKEKVIISDIKEKSSGSEDFSYISQKVPGLMIALSAGSKKEGYRYFLHQNKVIFNEEVIKVGVYIYTLISFIY